VVIPVTKGPTKWAVKFADGTDVKEEEKVIAGVSEGVAVETISAVESVEWMLRLHSRT
jgi:hypothetical protein